ncbi:toxin [Candidatus Gottesmanbacteria bacterium RIFCSPHIGHO2_01_FULL_39_10]|uniref:Toxin n=1 Tax=Candidatus Gottesmanbacteria bacterium RIFCSPHIGHO2_01_FULL_39_10 TaxID=1798375 RepID=A0A1F5ZPP4_9BACT|nr:MAG: toxin [Candidatus Gottesmanbacteria bacterium RIFCSPHIGHO2_01_FULL_39_10]
MRYLVWDEDKNDKLKKERGISFEEVAELLFVGDILDVINNPSKNFPNQKVYVLKISGYVYYVPFVKDEEKIFLKTIIPSRKARKKYL